MHFVEFGSPNVKASFSASFQSTCLVDVNSRLDQEASQVSVSFSFHSTLIDCLKVRSRTRRETGRRRLIIIPSRNKHGRPLRPQLLTRIGPPLFQSLLVPLKSRLPPFLSGPSFLWVPYTSRILGRQGLQVGQTPPFEFASTKLSTFEWPSFLFRTQNACPNSRLDTGAGRRRLQMYRGATVESEQAVTGTWYRYDVSHRKLKMK